jgi:hypothetical protein
LNALFSAGESPEIPKTCTFQRPCRVAHASFCSQDHTRSFHSKRVFMVLEIVRVAACWKKCISVLQDTKLGARVFLCPMGQFQGEALFTSSSLIGSSHSEYLHAQHIKMIGSRCKKFRVNLPCAVTRGAPRNSSFL